MILRLREHPIHQISTEFNEQSITDSTSIGWRQQDSTDFSEGCNLVRDQWIGGSNSFSRPFSLVGSKRRFRSPCPARADFETASDTAWSIPCQSDRATAELCAD